MKIYVLHENDEWVEPLRKEFAVLDLPFEEWFLDEGLVPFDEEPPLGVFYNRMSASSHTRGHRWAPELTHAVLEWLEAHDRRVVNGTRALYLETSKAAQYAALSRVGERIPRTLAAVGRERVLDAARRFGDGPYLVKPNRGGKGLGVRLFESLDEIVAFLEDPGEEAPIDGTWLVQEYIRSPEPFITRCEFVGGRFLYAVRVDTRDGFELCPADVCAVDGVVSPDEKFTILAEPPPAEQIDRYVRCLRENSVEVAGLEFIVDAEGHTFTYDMNTNTNYNASAEARARVASTGMGALARFLGGELERVVRK